MVYQAAAGVRQTGAVGAEQEHWERVYAEKAAEEVSWFEPVPGASLGMIDEIDLPLDAPIVDVGGGASGLAAALVARGHSDLTVLDISAKALERARAGFPQADRVAWIVGDVRTHDFGRRFALWHDRAVFHFMVSGEDRRAYLIALERALEPCGHAILATFGPQGPSHCSGLPVARYSAAELAAAIGDRATLVSSHLHDHRTPGGASQQFLYAHFIAPAARRYP